MSLKLRSETSGNSPVFTHVVARPFQGDGLRRSVGELVDTRHWRNTHLLTMRGYLFPVNGDEMMSRTTCDRYFTDYGGRVSSDNARAAKLKLLRGKRSSLRVVRELVPLECHSGDGAINISLESAVPAEEK